MSNRITRDRLTKAVVAAATWASVLADMFGATRRLLETLPKPVTKVGA